MRVFYLIGPGGADKTTVGSAAQQLCADVSFIDMDDMIGPWTDWDHAWHERFFDATVLHALEIEGRSEGTSRVGLVALGSGSLKSDRALPFVQARHERTIHLDVHPSVGFRRVIERGATPHRDHAGFEAEEYSPSRTKLYLRIPVVVAH